MAGDVQAAVKEANAAVESAAACADFDDLYVLHARASSVFAKASMQDASATHSTAAERCLVAFTEFQAELRTSVDEMVARVTQLEKTRTRPGPGSERR